jgi:membrane associated rhomboid family serine protease
MMKSPAPGVIAIMAICICVEAVLQLADYDIIDVFRLRRLAYENGGFWPGLLQDWTPNYALQPVAMFLTYGFLHGGLLHLTVNMLTLYSLGSAVADRVGELRFLVIYVASILGGAIGFGLLAPTLRPMVGASGALFGLAGAIVAWDFLEQMGQGEVPVRTLRVLAFLVALNLILWWAMDGQLAWETHLGGFIAGALAGTAFARRSADSES